MKRTRIFSLGMLCILSAACPVAASDITIYNHSFQDGGPQVDIPQWGDVDMTPEAPADSPSSVYQAGPDASNFFNGIGVDGDQFALIDANGFYAYQDTAATFVSGAAYDLVVAVGRRADHDEYLYPTSPWQISLHYSDGTQVAALSGLIEQWGGGFMSDQSLHYVAQPQDAGQTIRVRIGGGTGEPGSTAGYDNVRLTTDAIIEPPPPGTILNYSFEEGGKQVDIPQWGDVDVMPYSVYQEGPDAPNFFGGVGVDGDYFALIDSGNYAYQDTSTTFVAGESYDLVVAVGRRQDHDEYTYPDTSWQISLNYADGTEVTSLSGVIGLGGGDSMSDQILHYVAQPEDAGRTIQVRIGGTAADGSTGGYDNVRLSIGSEPLLLGDANADGMVDDKDASILGAHWQQQGGANWLDGDFNGDHNVNDADAAILAAHWGEGGGEGSVPEPGSVALLAGMAVMGVVYMRRRKA